MLKQIARWSNENRIALRWRWLARLRPSERFFWSSFARGDLGEDWWRLLGLDRCTCAERLEAVNASANGKLSTPSAPVATSNERRLIKMREKMEERALEPDSHWQLSYNLGCFHAIRAGRLPKSERKEWEDEALRWLERSLDRPRISQLVREWVHADGDLKPLRGRPEFDDWASRVPPLLRKDVHDFDDIKASVVTSEAPVPDAHDMSPSTASWESAT